MHGLFASASRACARRMARSDPPDQHKTAHLVAALSFVALIACGGQIPHAARVTATAGPPVADQWPPAYLAALEDSKNPEPNEVANDLVAITSANPALRWRMHDSTDHVLMVSLVPDTTRYSGSVHAPYTMEEHYAWVTAFPELQDVCRAEISLGKGQTMRLRQLLGLTPNAKVDGVVEFWVRPNDLFRPAPDPEITDRTAGLNMPKDVASWYRQWFNELRSHQYFQSRKPKNDAYPWTQLGYTYDWAPGPEKGLSEFVIKANSQVYIESITPVAEYCGSD